MNVTGAMPGEGVEYYSGMDRGVDGRVNDARVVQREALLTRLLDKADVPVVVVHAGAGFGKSTVAAQWARRDPRPHVMVRIARFHDEPAALALAIIDSLEGVGPGVGEIRTVVTGAEPGFSALLLPALSGLAADRKTPLVVVVDDVQLLTRPECHEVLRAVADGLPQGSQFALLSRVEPPAWVARTRSQGRLLEIGASDLAFDEVESRCLLDSVVGTVSTEQADSLIERAEGWPVGLYLMTLSLQARRAGISQDAAFAPKGSDRFIVDYLRSEILAELPEHVREFLRRTSILDELTGPLCDAILDRRDSAAVLTRLSHELSLVVALDDGGHRYRYHHLLADALQADLDGQEPWLTPELHLRASVWFEAHGDQDSAIRHAKAAGDLERVGVLVWAGIPACIASGRPDRLVSWLADLDDLQIGSDRWLTLAAAWLGLQTGSPDRMTRWLIAAEGHAGADWTDRVSNDTYAASLAQLHVLVGDFGLEASMALCRGIQSGLPRDSAFRVAALHNEGVALTLTRRFELGRASLQEAERLARALGVPIIEANALAWRGVLALLADDWALGAPMIARAGELVRLHHLDRLATSVISVTALALLQAARGNKDEARVTLGTARRLTSQVTQIAPWFAVAGPLMQARVAMILGDGALARTLHSEALGHMNPDLADTLLSDFLADTEARLRTLQVDGLSGAAITPAELRVMQFLPSRLTFQQIGEHLFLSQHTVKSHAKSIYRKLGVVSRDEAVARAQSLGLVESLPSS